MLVEDKKKLVDVTFKYPFLMNGDAKQIVIDKYNELLSLKEELSSLRMLCIENEKIIKEKEKEFKEISNMFELVYDTKEIKYITGECNTVIINPTDASRPTYKVGG